MADSQPSNIDKKRILFEIPDFQAFGETLHDRLHAILYHIEEWETKFTLITNLFDRDSARIEQMREKEEEELEALIYSGTKRQRTILEKENPEYYIKEKGENWDRLAWRKERDKNWQALLNHRLTRDLAKVETFTYFDQFRNGDLDLSDIQILRLKEYFESLDNILKENEKPIIADYFDIEQDLYIGIPLLGMGLFQGIVWILFNKAEETRFSEPKTIRRLIKLFQLEYDSLTFSWDVKGAKITSKSLVKDSINAVISTNPIQEECNVLKYYEISKNYHEERIDQNEAVEKKIKDQYLKTAIITILLDSFAHNISAHSLTTLSWWFRERAEYFEKGKELVETLGRGTNPVIRYSQLTGNSHLSRELQPLFKFLLEKGAFWSGITRQTNFAGKISSLYSVLWFDFVNNPLYLGTIAHTEEINKLRINITIYESEERPAGMRFKNTKKIKRNRDGQLLDGEFAVVNLDDFSLRNEKEKRSLFVEEGALYRQLKPELENLRAFFPGGVVGKHAFFTLLENEIRNVKHYKGEALRAIQRDGLVLNISIHERPVDSENMEAKSNMTLLKIGVWLKHPVDIEADLLLKRIDGLDVDIVTEDTFQPRLGGNFQDKICASMLLTNTFDRVQDKDSPLGVIYYPWIKTAGYKIREDREHNVEFEVSQRKYKEVTGEEFKEDFTTEAGSGYLKKYFHLWKGADIMFVENETDLTQSAPENFARFHFLYLENMDLSTSSLYKSNGIIRIISGLPKPNNIAEAYRAWFPRWLKTTNGTRDIAFNFIEGETLVGRITYENGEVRFENVQQIRDADNDDELYETYKAIPNRIDIAIEHGSKLTIAPDKFNYRTYGELISRFCKGISPMYKVEQMDAADALELLEAIGTRICIFDRRSYSRLYLGAGESGHHLTDPSKRALQLARLELYRKQLFLDFRNESTEHWDSVQQSGFLNCHFLVLHLSFIESMKDKAGNLYSEDRILDFIDDEILQGVPPEKVGDDFILVITTGRGRMAWWEKVKSNPVYSRFTTFRPIESILGAVEDALQMPDDIDLKYNLTKLLFGS